VPGLASPGKSPRGEGHVAVAVEGAGAGAEAAEDSAWGGAGAVRSSLSRAGAVGPGKHCQPRHSTWFPTLVSEAKWHPVTWRATFARPQGEGAAVGAAAGAGAGASDIAALSARIANLEQLISKQSIILEAVFLSQRT